MKVVSDEQLVQKAKVLAQLFVGARGCHEPAVAQLVEEAVAYGYRIGYRTREMDEARAALGLCEEQS